MNITFAVYSRRRRLRVIECPWRLDSDLFVCSLQEHTRKQGYERDMIYSS